MRDLTLTARGAVDIHHLFRVQAHADLNRGSAALVRLSRLGLIEREKNALVVKDLERLTEMVYAATGE